MDKFEEEKDFINLGVVVDKDKALMIRRKKKEIGKNGAVLEWAFPGGKQILKETIEIANILAASVITMKNKRKI